MPSLYDITEELKQLITEMELMGVEGEVIEDTLAANSEPFEEKVAAIAGHIKNMQADVLVFKEESKRLAEEAKKIEKKIGFWTNYIDENMKKLGMKELRNGVHQIKYRKGSEVVEIDETRLPKTYWVEQEPKPMGKNELKKLLKDGQEIPGVALVRNPDSIQIK